MSEKLNPCPFCGGEADYRTMDECVYIKCARCGCNTQTFHYKERREAINAWNRRPSPWHTGIPKEKGRYACLVRDKKCILDKYVILEWHDDSIEWGGWFRPEYTGDFEVLGWMFIGDCPYGQIKSPFDKLKTSNEENNNK